MISTITNPTICVRILQIPQFAVSGSVIAKRPKSKNIVLGFLYVIKEYCLRADTNFQENRLKTERLVPFTKRRVKSPSISNRKWIWDRERPKLKKK